MIDHVSDTLVDPFVPLKRMVTAAEMGNIASVEECSAQFISHAEQLAHVCKTHKLLILLVRHLLCGVFVLLIRLLIWCVP